jgi:hypothetical protein
LIGHPHDETRTFAEHWLDLMQRSGRGHGGIIRRVIAESAAFWNELRLRMVSSVPGNEETVSSALPAPVEQAKFAVVRTLAETSRADTAIRFFPSMPEAEEFMKQPAKFAAATFFDPYGEPGEAELSGRTEEGGKTPMRVSNDAAGWRTILPVIALADRPAGAPSESRFAKERFILAKAAGERASADSSLNAILGRAFDEALKMELQRIGSADIDIEIEDGEPEPSCVLAADWRFAEIVSGGGRFKQLVLSARKKATIAAYGLAMAARLEKSLRKKFPAGKITSQSLATFWSSWQVWGYLFRFCDEALGSLCTRERKRAKDCSRRAPCRFPNSRL